MTKPDFQSDALCVCSHCRVDDTIRLYDSMLYNFRAGEEKDGVSVRPNVSRTLAEGVALRVLNAYQKLGQGKKERQEGGEWRGVE